MIWSETGNVGSFPLPGQALSIEIPVEVKSEGEYYLQVWIPKASKDKIHLVEETLPCVMLYDIDSNRDKIPGQRTYVIESEGEFGWADVVLYRASYNFHLDRGTHIVKITGTDMCQVSATRGAAITIERDEALPTEHFLFRFLLIWVSRIVAIAALIYIAFVEYRRQSN